MAGKSGVVYIFLVLVTVSSAQECEVDCSGQSAGSYVPDPYDCQNYYGCLADGTPTDVPFTCPDGEYFSSSYDECRYGSCSSECDRPSCSLTCHETGEFIANPHNCSQFFLCTPSGEPLLGECTADRPFFDGVECVADQGACCDPCTPVCPGPGFEIMDPEDCTKFYFCDSSSDPVSSECGPGEYFDVTLSQCTPSGGEQCQDLCRYGVVIPPTTDQPFDTTTEDRTTTTWWYHDSSTYRMV